LSQQTQLIQDISSSLKSVVTDAKNLDFEAIEQAKVLREENIMSERLRRFETQRQMKQAYFKDLQAQVEDSLKRKSADVENIKLQELKDTEYINMRDERDLNELKRIRWKHHGDKEVKQQSDKKDIFSRLHSAPAGYSTSTRENENVELSFYSQGSITEVEDTNITSVGNEPTSGEKVTEIKGDVLQVEENSEDKLTKVCPIDDVDTIIPSEIEEKFNPDKIITTDPPAYKGVLSYDSGDIPYFCTMLRYPNNVSNSF